MVLCVIFPASSPKWSSSIISYHLGITYKHPFYPHRHVLIHHLIPGTFNILLSGLLPPSVTLGHRLYPYGSFYGHQITGRLLCLGHFPRFILQSELSSFKSDPIPGASLPTKRSSFPSAWLCHPWEPGTIFILQTVPQTPTPPCSYTSAFCSSQTWYVPEWLWTHFFSQSYPCPISSCLLLKSIIILQNLA